MIGDRERNRLQCYHCLHLRLLKRIVVHTPFHNEYDYNDIVYPVPFNQLFNDISKRYSSFGGSFENLPSYVITGDIPEWMEQFSDTVMVTGASENHAYGSFNCLYPWCWQIPTPPMCMQILVCRGCGFRSCLPTLKRFIKSKGWYTNPT